jgi:hypothetical protein
MIQAFAAEGGSGTPSLQAWGKSLVPIGTENLEALDLTNTTCAQCPHRVAYRAVYVDRVYGDPIENVKLFLDDGGVRVCFYLSYWKDNHQGRRYWETLTELARSVKATTQTQSPRGEH